jgi:hypothetical protein
VDKDARDTSLMRGAQHLDRMAVVGVYPTTPKQRDDLEATLLRSSQRTAEATHLRKRAVGNRRVNTWKILRYALPTPNVEMPNLAVPHLASGKPDRFAACSQCRVWVLCTERSPVRQSGSSDRVACAASTDAESVNDDQRESRCGA